MAAWYDGIAPGQWGVIAIGTINASGTLQSGGAGVGAAAVWTAWGGAVLTEQGVYNGTTFVTGPALVAWGGGHTDYDGQELYALANLLADTPVYLRLRDRTSPSPQDVDQDGSGNPVSRHTYQAISWIGGANNALFSIGYLYRYIDSGGGTTSHWGNFNQSNPNVNQPWSTKAASDGAADLSCWDSTTNRVWYHVSAANQVGYYDVATDTYANDVFKSPLIGTNAHSAIDTSRGVWFAVWTATTVQGYRLNNGENNDYYTVTTTGTPPGAGTNKSIIYDPVDDRFVVYSGNGKQIFFLTPPSSSPYQGGDAWVWSSTTPASGDTPGTQQTNGTFGRFAYVPAPIRGYLLWNSHLEQPIFFRPASTELVPVITSQPGGSAAPVGGTTTFSVTATSSGGPLVYQWHQSTDRGETWASVSGGSGGTTATYTTPVASSGTNGTKYRVVVTDDNDTVTSVGAWFFTSGLPSAGKGAFGHGSSWAVKASRKAGARNQRAIHALRQPMSERPEQDTFASAWRGWFFPAATGLTAPAVVMASGALQYKLDAGPSDLKVYVTSSGARVEKLAPAGGDTLFLPLYL